MNIEIKYNIKNVRLEKGLTLQNLSKLSGVSVSQINDIENNKKHPTVFTLVLISMALNEKPENLYEIFPL